MSVSWQRAFIPLILRAEYATGVNHPACLRTPWQAFNTDRTLKDDIYDHEHPARRLSLDRCPNFRDFGGYATEAGREVKWGFLFRSGQLSDLTDADQERVAELELELVCDFRHATEQDLERSRLPKNPAPRVALLCISPGNLIDSLEQNAGTITRADMFNFMVSINRSLALGQREQYASMFKHMLETGTGKTLVHCAVGKDRTGFAAAIILLALGVSRETVLFDYMLTRHYLLPEREVDRLSQKYGLNIEANSILPMLEVYPEYLQAALGAIDEHYPNMEVYLDQHLGVDETALAELRGRYLA